MGLFASITVLLCVIARIFGPLLAAPMVALGMAVAGGFHPLAPKWSAITFAALGVLVPIALEIAGITAPAYAFAADGMLIRPMLAELPRAPTTVYLTASSLGIVLSVTAYVLAIRRSLEKAQHTALVQSWQLRQLVPEPSHEVATEPGHLRARSNTPP
jgi:hypothetical protein